MPGVLKGIATAPSRASAMTPPVPPSAATSAATTPSWWEQFTANQMGTSSIPANDGQSAMIDELKALRQEVSDLRGEQRIAAATIASGTSKTARILERVTPDGDAISTRSAA